MKYERVVFEICEGTDGQTDRPTYRQAHSTSSPYRGGGGGERMRLKQLSYYRHRFYTG